MLLCYKQDEHKIQSSVGPLAMQLASVPKMIKVLREDWAPSAFCVSFKVIRHDYSSD